jgi:tetratricopeptide (TPR) repeat protein
MAVLGIIQKFKATHGSREIRSDEFKIELTFQGEISDGFVDGVDYSYPKQRLTKVLGMLDDQYLDDVVGRATNENIAMYLLYELRDLPLHSLKIQEGEEQYVEVFFSEVDFDEYPGLLGFNKAQSLLFRETPELAIDELNEAIELKKNFAEAYNLRGRCYKYQNRHNLALSDYLQAIQIKPDFGEAYRNLGNVYYYLDMIELMIPSFTKAIELMPDSALAYNNRGFAYQKLNEFELALEDHNKAIEIDSNYAEAYRDRADAHTAVENKGLAEKDYAKAEELINSGRDTYAKIIMY